MKVSIQKEGAEIYRLRWYTAGRKARPSWTVHGPLETAERAAEAVKAVKRETGRALAGPPEIRDLIHYLEKVFLCFKSDRYAGNMKRSLEILEDGGHIRLDKITLADIERIRASLIRRYAKSTIKTWQKTAGAAFSKAVDYGLCISNPFTKVNAVKVPAKTIRVITEAEERKLFEACAGGKKKTRDRVMVALGLYGGLRVQDLPGVNINDHIHIEKNNIAIKIFSSKVNKWRTVTLPGRFADDVKKLRNSGCYCRPFLLTGNAVSKWFARLSKRAGVRCSFKDLRSTCGTRLARKGLSAWQVKQYLGHRRISTTESYYIGLMSNDVSQIWGDTSVPGY